MYVCNLCLINFTFQVAQWMKNPPASVGNVGDMGLTPVLEDPLEEEMATHSSILAWKCPWAEKPGRLYRPWDLTSQT